MKKTYCKQLVYHCVQIQTEVRVPVRVFMYSAKTFKGFRIYGTCEDSLTCDSLQLTCRPECPDRFLACLNRRQKKSLFFFTLVFIFLVFTEEVQSAAPSSFRILVKRHARKFNLIFLLSWQCTGWAGYILLGDKTVF